MTTIDSNNDTFKENNRGRVTFKLESSSEDGSIGYYRDTVVMRDSVVIPTDTTGGGNDSNDDDDSRDTASLLAGFTGWNDYIMNKSEPIYSWVADTLTHLPF